MRQLDRCRTPRETEGLEADTRAAREDFLTRARVLSRKRHEASTRFASEIRQLLAICHGT